MLRVPAGITHVVLDTPGGIHGFELARIVMFADAIVMPVCSSMFDRESAEPAQGLSRPRTGLPFEHCPGRPPKARKFRSS